MKNFGSVSRDEILARLLKQILFCSNPIGDYMEKDSVLAAIVARFENWAEIFSPAKLAENFEKIPLSWKRNFSPD